MHGYLSYLESLPSQENAMLQLLEKWVGINSWSENLEGLQKMRATLEDAFSSLNAKIERIALPPRKKIDSRGNVIEIPSGEALSIKKNSKASFKVLLAGHYDTVYPPSSSFQSVERLDQEILRGPGTADMKGGLLIILKSLETFEKSPYAEKLSWEVLITPDEEIGSPSSESLFLERASKFNVGLIYEPAFPDGSLVNERKGSVNYTIISRGKAAHAGRDFYSGRNAIMALARFAQELEKLNDKQHGVTVNIGAFEGGGIPNVVPDLAICKVNIRMQNAKDLPRLSARIQEMVNHFTSDGVKFEWHQHTQRPPKSFDKHHRLLFEALGTFAKELDMDLKWQPSGGVCDGNLLAAAGLPTIDTLGAIGGHIHTHDEFIFISSLVARTKLSAGFLMKLAENKYFLEKFNE